MAAPKTKKDAAFDEERFSALKAKAEAKTITPAERLEYRKLTLQRRELALTKQMATLRERERKADTHHKIKLGGLVIAAGLGDWDEATLRGALSEIAATTDAERLVQWRNVGGAQYNAEIKARQASLSHVLVSFSSPPSDSVRTALKAKGLGWVDENQRWEGVAVEAEVAAIVQAAGGRVEVSPA